MGKATTEDLQALTDVDNALKQLDIDRAKSLKTLEKQKTTIGKEESAEFKKNKDEQKRQEKEYYKTVEGFQKQIQKLEEKLQRRIMKCLDYRTPKEVLERHRIRKQKH